MKEGEAYQHLDTPTGYHVDRTPEHTLCAMNDQLHEISESSLAPWQKINAVNTFIALKIDL
mgnify:FL=1